MKPFTVVRGGLHPDEKQTKPVKTAKYREYQLQLMERMKARFLAQRDKAIQKEEEKTRYKKADL